MIDFKFYNSQRYIKIDLYQNNFHYALNEYHFSLMV